MKYNYANYLSKWLICIVKTSVNHDVFVDRWSKEFLEFDKELLIKFMWVHTLLCSAFILRMHPRGRVRKWWLEHKFLTRKKISSNKLETLKAPIGWFGMFMLICIKKSIQSIVQFDKLIIRTNSWFEFIYMRFNWFFNEFYGFHK